MKNKDLRDNEAGALKALRSVGNMMDSSCWGTECAARGISYQQLIQKGFVRSRQPGLAPFIEFTTAGLAALARWEKKSG